MISLFKIQEKDPLRRRLTPIDVICVYGGASGGRNWVTGEGGGSSGQFIPFGLRDATVSFPHSDRRQKRRQRVPKLLHLSRQVK